MDNFPADPGERIGYEARASGGSFDTAFYAVQAIELIAGATNLTPMGLNIRDGRRVTRRRKITA